MSLTDNGRNAMLTGGLGNVIAYLSKHTAIPDTSGSNETSGGSYARQAITWAAASGGTRANSGALTTPIAAATTIVATGFWSAVTTGTFYGWAPIGSTKKGYGSATASTDTIQSKGHGLSNTNRVCVSIAAETLPTGLSATVLYYVVGATTDTFQLSLTSGGSAVDITADGEMFWQDCVPEVFGSAGNITEAIGAVVLDASIG